jgi:hypothetical protein
VTCTKPFRFIGLSIFSLVLIGAVIVSLIFGLFATLYYKRWNEKTKSNEAEGESVVSLPTFASHPDVTPSDTKTVENGLKKSMDFAQYESEESEGDGDDEAPHPSRLRKAPDLDSSLLELNDDTDCKDNYEVRKGSTFQDRPWNRDLIESPSVSPPPSTAPANRPSRRSLCSDATEMSVMRTSRVPGYLQYAYLQLQLAAFSPKCCCQRHNGEFIHASVRDQASRAPGGLSLQQKRRAFRSSLLPCEQEERGKCVADGNPVSPLPHSKRHRYPLIPFQT